MNRNWTEAMHGIDWCVVAGISSFAILILLLLYVTRPNK